MKMLRSASTVYFGATAANYERERAAADIWRLEHDTITGALAPALRPQDRVLDVAAGTGRWLDLYAQTRVRPILLDISSDMLQTARVRARERGCEIEVVEGNILDMTSVPRCDWLISTRFFNWIPLSRIEHILRLAADAGIARMAFTVRTMDGTAGWRRQFGSMCYWQKKNYDVLRGRRMKGFYYLQSGRRLRRMLDRLGLQLTSEHVIERTRGDVYTLFVVSLTRTL